MTTPTQESIASPRVDFNAKNGPDHLLILVHGILARYSKSSNSSYSGKACSNPGETCMVYEVNRQ